MNPSPRRNATADEVSEGLGAEGRDLAFWCLADSTLIVESTAATGAHPEMTHTRTRSRSRDTCVALELYLGDICSDGALLTAAEECSLSKAIHAGDDDARSRMILANLRLVVKIARDYLGRGLTLEDLVGEGNLGLIRAAEDFDPSFGTRFSTYASYWIKQAIRHALTNTTAVIRLPAHTVGLLAKWRREERALARELGQTPTHDQIAISMGLTGAQRGLINQALLTSSIRYESSSSEEFSSWSPENTADDGNAPDFFLEHEDQCRDLYKRLERLDDRERTIVSLRFGLGGEAPLTLKEVGRQLGVTREWVRKIEVRAVRKLDDGWIPEPPKAKSVCRGRNSVKKPAAKTSNPRSASRTVAAVVG